MPISSWNKRQKRIRIKLTKQQIKSWSPVSGINVLQYQPEQKFTQVIERPNGLTSRIKTQSTGSGEFNIALSASGATFEPHERRYKEDIEKAMEGLNIVTEKVTAKEEPNDVNIGNEGMNLEYMEHKSFLDLPSLDPIDKVRTIAEQNKTVETKYFTQAQIVALERILTRKPFLYGSPSNAQANPLRFCKLENQGMRDHNGLKTYSAKVGVY